METNFWKLYYNGIGNETGNWVESDWNGITQLEEIEIMDRPGNYYLDVVS